MTAPPGATIAEIQRAAREGIYDIRGFGAKRRLPHFDDLLFLGASMSSYPLEGYRERCGTDVEEDCDGETDEGYATGGD